MSHSFKEFFKRVMDKAESVDEISDDERLETIIDDWHKELRKEERMKPKAILKNMMNSNFQLEAMAAWALVGAIIGSFCFNIENAALYGASIGIVARAAWLFKK